MSTYASDEEQVEALKRWWKENGSSLLTGVVLVLVVYFGVGQFQNSRLNDASKASDLYQQLSDLALNYADKSIPENDLLAAQTVYSQLKAEFNESIYTRYAALVMARFQVENNQLDMAAKELQWILDNPDLGFLRKADEELFVIARLRLAKVKFAQGELDQTLALLTAAPVSDDFSVSFSELEGDVQLQKGNQEAARVAYQKALDALMALGGGNPVILRLKLQEVGVNPSEL